MLKKMVLDIFNFFGFDILRIGSFSIEKNGEFLSIYKKIKKYSLTSIERLYSLYNTIQYTVKYDISGDIVECGVWKGGSAMLCALTLKSLGQDHRKIFLYDTYNGMPAPTDKDHNFLNFSARDFWEKNQRKDHNRWHYAQLDEVKKNMYSIGYPKQNIIFVEGKVEDTIILP